MFSMMFHRLIWTNFVYYFQAIRLFLSSSVNLTSHFSNFSDYRQRQIPNAQTKYYEIWPAYTKTPHDTTHKIANLYFEFKCHFLTLQKKFRLLLNKGVETATTLNHRCSSFVESFHDISVELKYLGSSTLSNVNYNRVTFLEYMFRVKFLHRATTYRVDCRREVASLAECMPTSQWDNGWR